MRFDKYCNEVTGRLTNKSRSQATNGVNLFDLNPAMSEYGAQTQFVTTNIKYLSIKGIPEMKSDQVNGFPTHRGIA